MKFSIEMIDGSTVDIVPNGGKQWLDTTHNVHLVGTAVNALVPASEREEWELFLHDLASYNGLQSIMDGLLVAWRRGSPADMFDAERAANRIASRVHHAMLAKTTLEALA